MSVNIIFVNVSSNKIGLKLSYFTENMILKVGSMANLSHFDKVILKSNIAPFNSNFL